MRVAQAPVRRCLPHPASAHRPVRSVRRADAFGLDALAFRAVRVSVRSGVSANARRRQSEEPLRRAGVSRWRHARRQRADAAAAAADGRRADPQNVPEEYRGWLGRITEEKTIPQIKQFVESGGAVVTVGSSTSMAGLLGVPLANALTEKAPTGRSALCPATSSTFPDR